MSVRMAKTSCANFLFDSIWALFWFLLSFKSDSRFKCIVRNSSPFRLKVSASVFKWSNRLSNSRTFRSLAICTISQPFRMASCQSSERTTVSGFSHSPSLPRLAMAARSGPAQETKDLQSHQRARARLEAIRIVTLLQIFFETKLIWD